MVLEMAVRDQAQAMVALATVGRGIVAQEIVAQEIVEQAIQVAQEAVLEPVAAIKAREARIMVVVISRRLLIQEEMDRTLVQATLLEATSHLHPILEAMIATAVVQAPGAAIMAEGVVVMIMETPLEFPQQRQLVESQLSFSPLKSLLALRQFLCLGQVV